MPHGDDEPGDDERNDPVSKDSTYDFTDIISDAARRVATLTASDPDPAAQPAAVVTPTDPAPEPVDFTPPEPLAPVQPLVDCGRIRTAGSILDLFVESISGAGVVGEDRLVSVLYLCVSSRFSDRPVSVVVKGPSSAGKSYTVDRTLDYFPASAYYLLTGMSEHALAYLKEPLSHRFLVLCEAAGMSGDTASYFLRSLLSEGFIRYVVVEKTKNGLEPKTITVEGPTGVIITTTALNLHPENETRLLSVPATDTPAQTASVLMSLACEDGDDAHDLDEWHAFQEWLSGAEHRVTIPYARRLAELVPPVAVRLRRDFATILNLIRAHAVLHQETRERDGDGCVVATVDDYAVVRGLVADLVADEVQAAVPETVRETVAAVRELVTAEEASVSYKHVGERLGLDKSSASRRCRQAVVAGYLKNLETRRGFPAQLVLGEPMPAEREVFPAPERLHGCTVNQGGNKASGV